MEDSELRDVLEKNSTKCFSIEYGGYLSNHMSHGIIALARLGASKERVEQFISWYSKKLETPEQVPNETALPENQTQETLDHESLLGKNMAYYPLLGHYRKSFQNECQKSMEAFISKHLPAMVDGIGCSALHPLIHTGYGYSAKSPELVMEGIAYLHHSYICFSIPEHNNFGKGSCNVLDVLEEMCKDEKLCGFDLNDKEQTKWLPPNFKAGGFQKKMAILASSRSERIAGYADKVQLPQWFICKLSEEGASFADVMRLCDWVIDSAVAVYTASESRNDFFLLHGVTGAWSLKQALSAMEGTEVQVLIKCVQEFVYVLFAVYIVQKGPKLNRGYLTAPVQETWEQIIEDTLNSQKDEHIYKMAQVCYERALTYPEGQQHVFKRACQSSLNFEFIF